MCFSFLENTKDLQAQSAPVVLATHRRRRGMHVTRFVTDAANMHDCRPERVTGLCLRVSISPGGRSDQGRQGMTDKEFRVIRIVPNGPILVRGPVRIELPEDDVVESDRFMVAICACRRSKTYPLCDTSHRRHKRAAASESKELEGPDSEGPT
jgi:CDGSH-type Zn-finger protein